MQTEAVSMRRLISRHRPLDVGGELLATAHVERPYPTEHAEAFLVRLLALHVWHPGDRVLVPVAAARVQQTTITAVPDGPAYGGAVVAAYSMATLTALMAQLLAYGYGSLSCALDATGALRPVELTIQARRQTDETDQAYGRRLHADYVVPLRTMYGAVAVLPAYDADGNLGTKLTVTL